MVEVASKPLRLSLILFDPSGAAARADVPRRCKVRFIFDRGGLTIMLIVAATALAASPLWT